MNSSAISHLIFSLSIVPGATIAVFELIDGFLPEKRGDSTSQKGYESKYKVSEPFVTKNKTDQAAEKYGEIMSG